MRLQSFLPPIAAQLLTACAAPAPSSLDASRAYQLGNRLSWGANQSAVRQLVSQGTVAYLALQLRPCTVLVPSAVQGQIDV